LDFRDQMMAAAAKHSRDEGQETRAKRKETRDFCARPPWSNYGRRRSAFPALGRVEAIAAISGQHSAEIKEMSAPPAFGEFWGGNQGDGKPSPYIMFGYRGMRSTPAINDAL
jgi:hypothetical protein